MKAKSIFDGGEPQLIGMVWGHLFPLSFDDERITFCMLLYSCDKLCRWRRKSSGMHSRLPTKERNNVFMHETIR